MKKNKEESACNEMPHVEIQYMWRYMEGNSAKTTPRHGAIHLMKMVCAIVGALMAFPICAADMATWEALMRDQRPHLPAKETRSSRASMLLRNSTPLDDCKAVVTRTIGDVLPGSSTWQTTFKSDEERIDVCDFTSADGTRNSFAVYGQLGSFTPYYWIVSGLSSEAGMPTREYLTTRCNVGEASSIQYAESLLSADQISVRELGTDEPMAVPYSRFWFFFVNDQPKANWAHPCRYVFVSEDSSSFTVLYKTMPPRIFDRTSSERVSLRPFTIGDDKANSEIKGNLKTQSLEIVTNKVYGFAQRLRANSLSYETGDAGKSYFVLISGGADPESNGIRFWCDTAMLYSTLTLKYGVSKANIHVYISDGTSSGPTC